jgi:hypothetical protein
MGDVLFVAHAAGRVNSADSSRNAAPSRGEQGQAQAVLPIGTLSMTSQSSEFLQYYDGEIIDATIPAA